MRKIISLALCGICAVSLSACGITQKPAPAPESAPEAPASEESVAASESAVEEPATAPTESVENEKEGRASSEVRESTALTPMFQFGDTTITLGANLIGDLFDGEAVFVPSETVKDLEFVLTPSQEVELEMTYKENPFTVTAKNDTTEPLTVKNAVVSAVYADQGPFYGIGGVKIGDPIDELSLALSDPFMIEEGVDTYSDITAYRYASQFNDTNVVFFVSEADNTVVSFYEKMPIHYITDAMDVSDKSIMSLIEHRSAPSHLTNSPYMLDVEGSDNAVSTLSDITWNSAKAYTIGEYEPEMTQPANILILEYEGVLEYDEEDIKNLSILNDSALESSNNVYGCFYLTNAYIDDNGQIQSDGIHELEGVYLDEEVMIANIFEKAGLSIDDYNMTEMPLV